MKEELKTLKDIEVKPEFDEGTQFTPYVHTELLKSEAVKWIKHFNRLGRLRSKTDFMDFFNLTEADLQEEKQN